MQVLSPLSMLPPPPHYAYGQMAPSGPSPMLSLADHLLQHLRLFAEAERRCWCWGCCTWLAAPGRADTLVQIDNRSPRDLATVSRGIR